jgi:hypothetical protein
VDVDRAVDRYAQGRSLRQIGAELGVRGPLWPSTPPGRRHHASWWSSSHPASTQQILQLRDQGLSWNEVAERVDMTVSGAWSRYRRARPPKPPRLGCWQQVLADALEQNLAIGVGAAVFDHLGRAPPKLS